MKDFGISDENNQQKPMNKKYILSINECINKKRQERIQDRKMNALKLDDAVRANWQMFDSAKDCYDKV